MARYYARYPEYLNLLNRDIDRIGFGVREMRLQPSPNGPIALFEHEGLIEPLPARLESYGTLQFVKIFPLIAKALETGNLAIVDELDIAIHPLVLPEIIRWFHDPVRNPRNAQLWMTCQNASLLEDLVKEEVLFCEKDSRGRTSVYGLADVQMVRRTDNYYKKYLGGVYGAVPHLG
jgi:predicted ATPase